MSNTKKPILSITVTAVVSFGLAIAGGYLYLSTQHTETEIPDTSIVAVEDNENGNDSVDASLKYAGYATLETDKNLITLNFTNPSKSRKSLSLDIIGNINGEDITLAKTSKVRPGYKINSVKYALDQEIDKGNYKGKFIVHFYNDQGEEEIVNTEIAIDLHVK